MSIINNPIECLKKFNILFDEFKLKDIFDIDKFENYSSNKIIISFLNKKCINYSLLINEMELDLDDINSIRFIINYDDNKIYALHIQSFKGDSVDFSISDKNLPIEIKRLDNNDYHPVIQIITHHSDKKEGDNNVVIDNIKEYLKDFDIHFDDYTGELTDLVDICKYEGICKSILLYFKIEPGKYTTNYLIGLNNYNTNADCIEFEIDKDTKKVKCLNLHTDYFLDGRSGISIGIPENKNTIFIKPYNPNDPYYNRIGMNIQL